MKKVMLIIIAMFMLSMNNILASDTDLFFGLGAGVTRGMNEGIPEERMIGPVIGANLLLTNSFVNGFASEFSVNYFTNGTEEYNGFSQYETTHITFDLRLRYYPWQESAWQPYAFAGIGGISYSVDENPPNYDPGSETSGVSLHIPVGAGLTYFFNETFGMDLNLSANATGTDNLNPVWDDINDANWMGKLSVLYRIVRFEKDSDGDGLTDKEELEIGTDPNNPDTDGDGLYDGQEVMEYKTDPLDPDTDGGGVKDGIEVLNGADPLDGDDDILSIGVGEKLILKNIEFDVAKTTITKKSERILGFAERALKTAKNMEILIVGHTDNTGSLENNITLSEGRAEAVKAWLVSKGIEATRLTTKGEGPNQPIVPNTTDANKQKNRRVEFVRTK